MDIRINTLTLHNFKGVRDASFIFGGSNARVEGGNGAGKSTVFDAFTWLLFGKDHQGQDWTNFDLKPIDPETREPIHGLDHWVEAELTIDGTKKTLKREVQEDWVKPRGEAEKVLKGHKQSFFIDGIDTATKKAYDAAVSQWIDENVFRMITNPLYFIDDAYTDWKSRRKALVSLIDKDEAERRGSLAEDFADLISEMRGEPMELFRKRIAVEKKANKERLTDAQHNIKAWTEALPEKVDTSVLKERVKAIEKARDERIAEISRKIAGIDAGISDINAANAEKRAEIDAMHREITSIRLEQQNYLDERLKTAREAARSLSQKKSNLNMFIYKANSECENLDKMILLAEKEQERLEQSKAAHGVKLQELGKKYQAEKEKAFTYNNDFDMCPTCGQPLPPEMIEAGRNAALEAFQKSVKENLRAIVEEAQGIKAHVAFIDNNIAGNIAALDDLKNKREKIQADLSDYRNELEEVGRFNVMDLDEIEKEARKDEHYVELAVREHDTNAKILRLSGDCVSVDALLTDRRGFESQKDATWKEAEKECASLRDALAAAEQRDRMLDMIGIEEKEERKYADEVARLERLEFRAQEYAKAEVDSMEDALCRLFRVARWKMFSATLEGGLTEMCEVTNTAGVPYRSMNDAMKILCGMDVIRVFSDRYGVRAPIFIDNAESITQKSFDTAAQVIRLVVTEGEELLTINE